MHNVSLSQLRYALSSITVWPAPRCIAGPVIAAKSGPEERDLALQSRCSYDGMTVTRTRNLNLLEKLPLHAKSNSINLVGHS